VNYRLTARHLIVPSLFAAFWSAAPAVASSLDTQSSSLTVSVLARGELVVPASIDFPDASPTAGAQTVPVSIVAKARIAKGGTATLTVSAADLSDGGAGDSITASRFSWTTSSAGYQAGTLSNSAVTMGQWGNSGVQNGSLNWIFTPQWTDNVGSYSTTINYTLSTP